MASIPFFGQTSFYQGKVRDVYGIRDQWLLMIASNRISAFDVILPRPIPHKGQVLNQVAAFMLEQTRDICPNWLLDTPTGNSAIGLRCQPIPVEMVIRGNLAGHAWRTYQTPEKNLCGIRLPDGLKAHDFFPTPIITPTTKAAVGHDEDISREDILAKGLVSEADYLQMEDYTRALFERGKQLAAQRGLILADTKYEFGKIGDTIYLMDEIHTPDSSRYFYQEGFQEAVETVCQEDRRYHPEAYAFLRDSLEATIKRRKKSKKEPGPHVGAAELLDGQIFEIPKQLMI
jgi:phosphoribosylaminoimidazole-succinocarboxamide synthase